METYLTKSGKVFLIFLKIFLLFFIVGVAIFFASSGCAVWEKYKISRIDDIKENFSEKDIASYHDMNSLRNAFREKWDEIEETIDEINRLMQAYPQNPDLRRKLAHYEKYRQSMLDTPFLCPEHISKGSERRYRVCSSCHGKGKKYLFWTCKECNGTGQIGYDVTVDKNCPNCGEIYRSSIYGKNLR